MVMKAEEVEKRVRRLVRYGKLDDDDSSGTEETSSDDSNDNAMNPTLLDLSVATRDAVEGNEYSMCVCLMCR